MDVPGSDCLKNTAKSALARRRHAGKAIKTAISACLSSVARNNTRLRAGLTWFCAHQAQILLGLKRKISEQNECINQEVSGWLIKKTRILLPGWQVGWQALPTW
jgi:hypothetical protein